MAFMKNEEGKGDKDTKRAKRFGDTDNKNGWATAQKGITKKVMERKVSVKGMGKPKSDHYGARIQPYKRNLNPER